MKKQLADFSFEHPLWQQNHLIIGIDEVGRGCLAGPVYVAGVCFSPEDALELATYGIHDSKKVSAKNREKLSPIILKKARCYAIADMSCLDIDTIGIVPAIEQAAYNVVQQILTSVDAKTPVTVFTDTFALPSLATLPIHSQQPIPQGDGKSISIAAASIIAKVARDAYMDRLSAAFPHYGWATNKGYGTKDHCNALQLHSFSEHHRKTFIKKYL